MEIRIISDNYDEIVVEHFPKAEVGINCRSNIVLKYNQGILVTSVESDEFENEALKYCSGIDIKKYETKQTAPQPNGLRPNGYGSEPF